MPKTGVYRYGYRIKRPKRLLLAVAFVLTSISSYTLYATNPPAYSGVSAQEISASAATMSQETLAASTVYLPKLQISFPYATGNASALNTGAWHRHPERGSVGEGNFILAAHRYRSGISPSRTSQHSPLYHIDKLVPGDYIHVTDESSQVFIYQITENFETDPDDIQIESYLPFGQHRLTLYSCTLEGAHDGRAVVVAQLTQQVLPSL